jgi:hypothetical protein
MSQRALDPSDFLLAMQQHWNEELKHLRGQQPLWKCFDCKRSIPREELPLRCSECSGPDLKGKKIGYRHLKIRQDAMICIKCVNKHDHLKKMVLDFQFQAYARSLERRATEAAQFRGANVN